MGRLKLYGGQVRHLLCVPLVPILIPFFSFQLAPVRHSHIPLRNLRSVFCRPKIKSKKQKNREGEERNGDARFIQGALSKI